MKCNLNSLKTYPNWTHEMWDSSEMNLKSGEYCEISKKDLSKLCQKLDNSVKLVWK